MYVARWCSSLVLVAGFVLSGDAAWGRLDPGDQKLIEEGSCGEIARERKNCSAAERQLVDRIELAKAGMVAANIAGIAAFATLGLGFIMCDDDSDAEEALAEVREIRVAIAEGARKKSCPL